MKHIKIKTIKEASQMKCEASSETPVESLLKLWSQEVYCLFLSAYYIQTTT